MANGNSSVTIVSSFSGNLFNVKKAFEALGANVIVTSCIEKVLDADRLVMPGVGSASSAISVLNKTGMRSAILRYAEFERPLLGICLGMQLLCETCTEHDTKEGLGLFSASVEPLHPLKINGIPEKLPRVGWYAIGKPNMQNWNQGVLGNVRPSTPMYFSHSYHVKLKEKSYEYANCEYGGDTITAAVSSNNIHGVQFHPELSAAVGLTVLETFLSL